MEFRNLDVAVATIQTHYLFQPQAQAGKKGGW